MNAIEELRKYISELSCEIRNDEGTLQQTLYGDPCLRKIADRIEDEYVELPRDKNGEVVHVGDFLSEGEGSIAEVMTIGHDGFTDLDGGFHNVDSWELVNPEPDSMERIKADAIKDWYEYWDCPMVYSFEHDCAECKSKHDGEVPREQYDVPTCEMAVPLDLIARTEKLLGGGE